MFIYNISCIGRFIQNYFQAYMSYYVSFKLDILDIFELAVENIGNFELHCADLVICSIQITMPIHMTIFQFFFVY